MCAVIAVWTNKGGSGKTSIAVSLARWSGFGDGRLLIDLDPQANASFACGYPLNSKRFGISEALIQHSFPEDSSAVHVELSDGTVFIPADIRMSDLDLLLRKTNGTPVLALAQLLSSVEADLIVIDCPPGENLYSKMALAAADYILIPTTLDYGAATGIQQAISICNKIKFGNKFRNEPAYNYNLQILGVVLNKVPPYKINICGAIKDVIYNFCCKNKIKVFKSEIKERVSPMTYINANQQSVFELPEDNKLRIEFVNLFNEIKEVLNER